MRPGDSACYCSECGVTCQGRYPGCPDVWKRGPRTVSTAVVTVDRPRLQLGLSSGANGGTTTAAKDDIRPGERAGLGRVVTAPVPPAPVNSGSERAGDEEWAPPAAQARPGTKPPGRQGIAPQQPEHTPPSTGDGRPRGIAPLPREQTPPAAEVVEQREPPPPAAVAGAGTEPVRQERDLIEPPDVTVAASESEAASPNGSAAGPAETPNEPVMVSAPAAPSAATPPTSADAEQVSPAPPVEPVERRADRPPQPALVGSPEVTPPPAEGDPRTHILKWMERKFDGLREEVRLMANGARRQRDRLDEVLERQAELEALIERQTEFDADPNRQAELDARQAELDLRREELDARRTDLDARRAEVDELVRRQEEVALRLEREAERREPEVERSTKLVQAANDELTRLVAEVVSVTESSVAAQRASSDRLRLLQTAVTRELRGLTTAVQALGDRSQDQVAALERRFDALSRRLPAAKPAAKTSSSPATAKPIAEATARARPATASKATKRTATTKAVKSARTRKTSAGSRAPRATR